MWNGCTNDVIHDALVARKVLLFGDSSPALCIRRRMSQQLSIFYGGEFCHSDSLRLLLLVTASYYLWPRMYMKSEKQAIVTRIKCDTNIAIWIWNRGGWTEVLLFAALDRPTAWGRKLLEKLPVAVDFPFLWCTQQYGYSCHKNPLFVPTLHKINPVTNFYSTIKDLFQYYSTIYIQISQVFSFLRFPQQFI